MTLNPCRFGPEDVEVLDREPLYQGFFQLERLRLRHRCFAGGWCEPLTRERFVRRDAVAVLPYDPEADSLVLIEQFRVGALEDTGSPWLLELVAGIVEPGETLEAVVHREAREEAGAELQALEPIASVHLSPGGSRERMHFYCGRVNAENLGGFHGLATEGEDIRALVVTRQEAMAALETGRINNAPAFLALQWLALHRERLCRLWEVMS